MSAEVWQQVYDRLARLIEEHRTTLVFVNTRRMAERVARQLSERLGEEAVTAHHGSMAKEQRLAAEQRLKRGELKALVATASLELGIDIGDVDLVCQIGSPRSIASFLQRVGRSGHAVGGMPKGRLFPLSRDDLVECAALIDSVRRGELDRLSIPRQPLDVLAQQIVAEVGGAGLARGRHFTTLLRRAWPYRALSREHFDAVVHMLAEGFSTSRGRRGALIHHDAINRVLRGRRGARLTALTSGGTIPDTADYQVVLEPEDQIDRHASTRTSPSRAWLATCSSSATPPIASCASNAARAGRGRTRPAADHPVLARRGARPQRRTVAPRCRVCAPAIAARLRRDASGSSAQRWLTDEIGIDDAAAEQLRRLSAARRCRARLPADAGHHGARALLRRSRRHAARHPLAVRQPHQSRLGPGAAQALLPQVQLRAAGGGDRGQHRAVADHRAQFRAGGSRALSALAPACDRC